MPDCIFCSIVANQAPSWRIYEDDGFIAFLDIDQATPGHSLVIPRRHAADLLALTAEEASGLMRAVHRVAALLTDRLEPLGFNLFQSNGAAAWQDVFHCHVHLVPRFGDDSLTPPWRSSRVSDDLLRETHQRLVNRE